MIPKETIDDDALADIRKDVSWDRDHVGAPGCQVRVRAVNTLLALDELIQLREEVQRYRQALIRIGNGDIPGYQILKNSPRITRNSTVCAAFILGGGDAGVKEIP